ncbi:MAG TPA: VOC family protein [Polyangiales bacterium]|nr:VOC family protein [Polyangiales bacterium]
MAGTLIIPILRYRDAPAAITFLTQAFGFEQRLVVPGKEPGKVVHAQLTFGSRMLMLSTHEGRQAPGAKHEAGDYTNAIYVVVDDADAHHARAIAAGAKITSPLEDWDHGGRGYMCEDCEGHVWSFGTYDPWTAVH